MFAGNLVQTWSRRRMKVQRRLVKLPIGRLGWPLARMTWKPRSKAFSPAFAQPNAASRVRHQTRGAPRLAVAAAAPRPPFGPPVASNAVLQKGRKNAIFRTDRQSWGNPGFAALVLTHLGKRCVPCCRTEVNSNGSHGRSKPTAAGLVKVGRRFEHGRTAGRDGCHR